MSFRHCDRSDVPGLQFETVIYTRPAEDELRRVAIRRLRYISLVFNSLTRAGLSISGRLEPCTA
jgi:hypothetical protein